MYRIAEHAIADCGASARARAARSRVARSSRSRAEREPSGRSARPASGPGRVRRALRRAAALTVPRGHHADRARRAHAEGRGGDARHLAVGHEVPRAARPREDPRHVRGVLPDLGRLSRARRRVRAAKARRNPGRLSRRRNVMGSASRSLSDRRRRYGEQSHRYRSSVGSWTWRQRQPGAPAFQAKTIRRRTVHELSRPRARARRRHSLYPVRAEERRRRTGKRDPVKGDVVVQTFFRERRRRKGHTVRNLRRMVGIDQGIEREGHGVEHVARRRLACTRPGRGPRRLPWVASTSTDPALE